MSRAINVVVVVVVEEDRYDEKVASCLQGQHYFCLWIHSLVLLQRSA